jgi:hypothetical protein
MCVSAYLSRYLLKKLNAEIWDLWSKTTSYLCIRRILKNKKKKFKSLC